MAGLARGRAGARRGRGGAAAARRDEDFLRHAVKELEALAPKPDDEETLAAERQMLRAGTALGEAVTQALGELEEGRRCGRGLARRASPGRAQRRQGGGPARCVAGGARPGAERGTEAQAQLEAARDALEFDPAGWRRSRSGCSRCAPLARKHNVTVADLAPLPRRWRPSSRRWMTARRA